MLAVAGSPGLAEAWVAPASVGPMVATSFTVAASVSVAAASVAAGLAVDTALGLLTPAVPVEPAVPQAAGSTLSISNSPARIALRILVILLALGTATV